MLLRSVVIALAPILPRPAPSTVGAVAGGAAAGGNAARVLVDFTDPSTCRTWLPVDDRIMGGSSMSSVAFVSIQRITIF